MNDSHEKKLEKLLGRAVELSARPDFADWCRKHPAAVDAIRSQPKTIANRRARMKRLTRYTVSTAAVLMILVAGVCWMLFGNGARNAWAEAIEKLSEIRNAVCRLHVYNGGHEQVSKIYLEGSRVRWEEAYRYGVTDLRQGKILSADRSTKTAEIEDLKTNPGSLFVLGGNPLDDMIRLKDASAERLPDERVGDTPCHVYRVSNVAFIGTKVPWVKVWLDPETRLPLRVHSVVNDSLAMTLDDFQWNEPFDKDLLTLDVPEGYTLNKSAENEGRSPDPTNELEPVEEERNTEASREIPTEKIAETLDMLGERIKANYAGIRSWSGTFDEKGFYRLSRDSQSESKTHAEVRFFAEPGKDLLRLDYKGVEESRWIRTSNELYRFPVSEPYPRIEGFPRIMDLDPSKNSRILFREPPGAARRYTFRGFMNPLSFFGTGRPYWEACLERAKIFRGEIHPELVEYARKNVKLRVRGKGDGEEYILTQRFKPVESGTIYEWVFSAKAGLNVVSQRMLRKGRLFETINCTFGNEKGLFIPTAVESNRYEDRNGEDSEDSPTTRRVYVLKQTQVNAPINPAVFDIQSLGLRDGDRMVDRIENEMFVFDGKKLVPAREFKLQPAAEAKREDARRAVSVNNMKQIALAMHNYHDAHKRFPPRAVFDKNGKPLLSWRVLLLPYMDEEELFKQFRLDEPWDSPHNKKLIEKMPQCFRSPASEAPANTTTYLVPVGPGTLFEGDKGVSIREITDGTSCTVMLVEAVDNEAVPWTKPDEFEVDPNDPKKGLVGAWPDGFLVGLADGSTVFVPSSVDPAILKAVFTYQGGEESASAILQY